MAEFLADDVVYHLPGGHLSGGTLHGRVEVLERAAKAALDCESPPSIRVIRAAEGDGARVP
jgi:ketosteroid isomerase-like protein